MSRTPKHFRHAFTLVELITAVALLVLVILAVGIIFRSASKAIGVSQASSEMFSNTRASNAQIDIDSARIDRNNGFLVIRSRVDAAGQRMDQLAFVASGSYAHRTGTAQAAIFDDPTVADSALIWIGHVPYQSTPDQSQPVPLDDVVGNLDTPTSAFYFGKTDSDYRLGRRALLLMPGLSTNTVGRSGKPAAAYSDPSIATVLVNANSNTESVSAHISSSRVDAVALTAQQLMTSIIGVANGRASMTRTEVDAFCFRSYAPRNAYDVEPSGVASPLVGAIRMNTVMLQGCRSLAVDWTDGSVDGSQNLNWWGNGNAYSGPSAGMIQPSLANGDTYTAVFSFDNKAFWPKALRLTYKVTDPRDLLQGGRVFTQIVKIP